MKLEGSDKSLLFQLILTNIFTINFTKINSLFKIYV